jgi:hypothetical protein
MYKCKHCEKVFSSRFLFANHVRWSHKDNSVYLNKISNGWGPVKKETVVCFRSDCSNEFGISYREGFKKEKYYCSRSCSNYREFSDEVKSRIAIRTRETKRNKYRAIFPERYKERECKGCGSPISLEKRRRGNKYCSKDCYIETVKREADTKNGVFKSYRRLARFDFNMSDYPEEFNFDLIRKYGWYSSSKRNKNLNGVSRDHMFSVKQGFEQGVDPNIISHPANCKLLRHNDNLRKSVSCSISLNELYSRIEDWDSKYNN